MGGPVKTIFIQQFFERLAAIVFAKAAWENGIKQCLDHAAELWMVPAGGGKMIEFCDAQCAEFVAAFTKQLRDDETVITGRHQCVLPF